jgi:prevent-host-death family protein
MTIMVIMTDLHAPGGAAGQPVSKVKARFSEFLRAAEHGEPVLITRHGRVVAALVGAEELRQLERLRAAGPEGGLASVAGGWEGSDELADLVERSRRVGTRNVVGLD